MGDHGRRAEVAALPAGEHVHNPADHHSLKNLLNQVIQTPEQQYVLSKFLGYSYTIIYKRGRENVAADALSRLPAEEGRISSSQLLLLACQPFPDWLEELKRETQLDDWLTQLRQQIHEKVAPIGFREEEGFVMFDHRFRRRYGRRSV